MKTLIIILILLATPAVLMTASERNECHDIANGIRPVQHDYQLEMCEHHEIDISCQVVADYPPHSDGELYNICKESV
jgi:hypothetical protein